LGSDDGWDKLSHLPSPEKGKWEDDGEYEEHSELVPQEIEGSVESLPQAAEEPVECTPQAAEEPVECTPQAIEELIEEPVKSIPQAIEEPVESIPQAIEDAVEPTLQATEDDDWFGYVVKKTKKGKKGKKKALKEEVEPVAQGKVEFGWSSSWGTWGAAAKNEKREETEELPIPSTLEEPELASPKPPEPENIVVVPSLVPDVEQNNVCYLQAQHILEGDGWQSCKKCRNVICQKSIQLLHGENLDD